MKNLWLFKRYFWKYKRRIALIFLLIAGSAIFEGIGISLFFPLIDFIQNGESFLRNDKFRLLFGGMNSIGIKVNAINFIMIIFFVILCRYSIVNFTQVLSGNTYNSIIKDIRDDGFKVIINAPMHYYQSVSSGKIVSMLSAEAEQVGQAINFMVQIAVNMCFVAVYAFSALFISWELVLIVGFVAFLRHKILGYCIKNIRALGKDSSQIRACLSSYLVGIYQGVDIIKSYATETKEEKRYKGITLSFFNVANRLIYNQSIANLADGLLSAGTICFAIYIAIKVLSIEGASIIVFIFIINRMVPCLTNVNDARIRIAQYTSGIVYLKPIFKDNILRIPKWGNVVKSGFDDKIIFDRVSFSYNNDRNFVLKDIDIVIKRNEKIAIVGESGSGKTTFIRLLLRLFEPMAGKIYIDGVRINELNRDSWKTLVSVVNQDTFIFDDTVENNIKYGIEDCGEDEFRTAVQRAKVDKFINDLPEKEKTVLGERGVKLSGGQRQRVAIARAFLRNSPILILDEATSSLDSITEGQVQDAIDSLAENRTVIIIAHRLSTIKKADRIIVLDKGKISEIGTHEELLLNGDLYRKYYNLQIY